MKIRFRERFAKDVAGLPKEVNKKLVALIESVKKTEKLGDLKDVKKIKGSLNAYRIRIGDYRVGVFVRCLNRKDIYRYFP